MARCARCGDRFSNGGEWVRVEHNHQHMQFESCFCSTDCAAAYLVDELDGPGR